MRIRLKLSRPNTMKLRLPEPWELVESEDDNNEPVAPENSGANVGTNTSEEST